MFSSTNKKQKEINVLERREEVMRSVAMLPVVVVKRSHEAQKARLCIAVLDTVVAALVVAEMSNTFAPGE